MTKFRSLDLNDTDVICKLMALDTDMSQFHYLCLEQGPLFKLIFDEFVTDAHRKGLQQKQAGMPGCPPHVSHFGRDYWKPQIEKSQVNVIQTLFTKFQVKWHELFSKFNADFYFPRAEPTLPSPWTRLNSELMNLATNICTICSKLTGAKDMFLASDHEVPNPDDGPKFTVTYRKPARAPLDALLLSLYQLSESESCRPTTSGGSPSALNSADNCKSPASCVV
jgi:hypothetical protein